MLHFDGSRTVIGSCGASTTVATHLRSKTGHATIGKDNTATYNILDSGNSSVSLSGEKLTVKINGTEKYLTNTWRGIQNNLTSDSTTDSLSAAQGKALKGSITTLEGYFTGGVAKTARQLVYGCASGDGEGTTNPYHLVGECVLNTTGSRTTNVMFLVNSYYSDPRGILLIQARVDSGNSSVSTNYTYAKWLVRNASLDTNKFIMTTKATSNSLVCRLYYKIDSSWDVARFRLLDEGVFATSASKWVLYNTSGGTAGDYIFNAIPSDETQFVSTDNTSAAKADQLNISNIGSATNPVYFANGVPVDCTYSLNKTVPANAVFTDHYDWSDITSKPLTLTKNATGFSISGGTTSKTLTVSANYTLGTACAKGVTDNSSATAVTSSDTNLITGRTLYYAGYVKSSGVTSITLKASTGISLDVDNTAITSTGTRTISLASGVCTTGTYSSVTVDTYGRVTAGTNPTTLSGYGITDAYTKDDSDGRYMRITGYTNIGASSENIVDLNTITTYGVYRHSDGNQQYVTNKPSGCTRVFRLVVERSAYASNSYIRQRYQEYNSSVVYERYSTNTGSSWSSWVKVQGNLADYLPLSGGTMTGGITMATDSSNAFNTKGILFGTDGAKGRIGAANAGAVGIYAAGTIYLRPNSASSASSNGVAIGTDTFTYNGNDVLTSDVADGCYLRRRGYNENIQSRATSESHYNLNSLTDLGIYCTTTNANSEYFDNKPEERNFAFRIEVRQSRTISDYIIQRFQYDTRFEVFERRTSNGGTSWGNWYKVQDIVTNYTIASQLGSTAIGGTT